MARSFTYTHILSLFGATALTFGGMLPLVNPTSAIRGMGFPPRIHNPPAAHTIMALGMARTTVIGTALWTFYLKGKYEEVDTLLVILGGYLGAIDAWVCGKEGMNGKAWLRGLSGVVICGWGFGGMTARG
jgi:hypothetical protein